MSSLDRRSVFFERARTFLPAEALLTEPEDCAAYATDWSKTPGQPLAVALPRNTNEVAHLLKLTNELEIPVVPSGGRTGLCGGATAAQGELVLSLNRMNKLFPVDTLSWTVRVQAGATTQSVHEHCAEKNLTWPIDLASKGSSQIGGNLSTNAGGLRVIRYGMARKWVLGLEAVTGQGTVLQLNQSLEKNNTGYDLLQLLIGSEGTLAVITEATLKLTRLPQHRQVLFFAVHDLKALTELFEATRQGPFDLLAFEFFSEKCLKAVEQVLNRRSKLTQKAPFYALVEIEISEFVEAKTRVENWLATLLTRGLFTDGCLAESSEDQKALWGLREGITESLSRLGRVRKYDVCVPVARIKNFLEDVEKLRQQKRTPLDLYLFGHLGDGSPHLNLVGPPPMTRDEFEAHADAFEEGLFPLLKGEGGSISAEHGVGLLKKKWVTYSRSAEELAWFQSIKQAFDPKNLLNPGKILDAPSIAPSALSRQRHRA